MGLVKGLSRFVLITLAISFIGAMIATSGTTAANPPRLTGLSALGAILVLLSPLLSALWLWRRSAKRTAQEASRRAVALAEEQAYQQDMLRRSRIERQKLVDAVDRHHGALERNMARAIRTNDYGAVVQDLTGEALSEFFSSIALDAAVVSFDEAKAIVLERLDIRRREQAAAGFDAASLPTGGHDFELWVASALIRYGWNATVTSASGDQGLDVIAEKNGRRIGLQCKLYGAPVGNKAVQEAHAGKVYYGVDAVAVLTNASFTPSAIALARATGVKLFSPHDIPDLFEKTFQA